MKLKLTLATATALGLLMGGAMADNNRSKVEQIGDDNTVVVEQRGTNNAAAEQNGSQFGGQVVLKQTGNENSMDIKQTGNNNNVATAYSDVQDGDGATRRGAYQTGSKNSLTVDQTSNDTMTGTWNGNSVRGVRQNSADDASAATNSATVTQGRLAGDSAGQSSAHRVGVLTQTHTGGAQNVVTIEQRGVRQTNGSNGDEDRSGNLAGLSYGSLGTGHHLTQNGSGNTLGLTQLGAWNRIDVAHQQGDGNTATILQEGKRNFIDRISQDSRLAASGNSATISLTGDRNGYGSGNNNGVVTSGLDGAAALAGADASSVVQIGGGNLVHYTVNGGNENQFGFRQDGTGNMADNVMITGDRNHLGVNQMGEGNLLVLAAIGGDDNVIGLVQNGEGNVADLKVTGDRNFGYTDFTSPLIPTTGSRGLTAGLITQDGDANNATLTTTGNDNMVGTLQDGNNNKITGTQNGNNNQAGVSQIGNSNNAMFAQTGGGNVVSISQ